MRGSILDTIFGDCIRCKDLYNCENCNENGCILCDDMKLPKAGKCWYNYFLFDWFYLKPIYHNILSLYIIW